MKHMVSVTLVAHVKTKPHPNWRYASFITSPLSLPSVPSKSITRVHGSIFWAFANHIPLVVCDLMVSKNTKLVEEEQASPGRRRFVMRNGREIRRD